MTGEPRWPTYEPEPGAPEPGAPEPGEPHPPAVTHRTPKRPRPRRRPDRGGRLRTGLFLTASIACPVVLVGGVALALVAGGDGLPGGGAPDALSDEGLAQLRGDVVERSGGTEVFRAVIYPEYAVVDLPVDATSQREESMHWDGDLSEFGGKGTASNGRVDLADVDATVVAGAVRTAKSLVEEPTTWYVIVDGPAQTPGVADRAGITAYASNEFSETAFVEVALDGTELRRVGP